MSDIEDQSLLKKENKSEVGDATPINNTENEKQYTELSIPEEKTAEELELENKRKARNAYHREYYKNNKEKFNKHVNPNRKVGERGPSKKQRYILSVLDEETQQPIISQKFKSLVEIANVIKVNPYTASMIYRGLYSKGKGKVKKTKRYEKFKIEKI